MTTGGELITIDEIDLDGLCEAMSDGSPDAQWYFHPATGDVRPAGDWSDGFDDDDLADQGWVAVDPSGSRVGFEDMELFAAAVGDVRARDLLTRSLEGKGAFRRFRDTLREFPEIRSLWHDWVDQRERARALRWLLDGGHVHEIEADAALGEARGAGQAALDAARTTGGEPIDLDAGAQSWPAVVARLERGETVVFTRSGRPFAALTPYD